MRALVRLLCQKNFSNTSSRPSQNHLCGANSTEANDSVPARAVRRNSGTVSTKALMKVLKVVAVKVMICQRCWCFSNISRGNAMVSSGLPVVCDDSRS